MKAGDVRIFSWKSVGIGDDIVSRQVVAIITFRRNDTKLKKK